MEGISIELDTVLHAAYIRLSDHAVVRTVALDDQVMVDLDEFGVAVGVEVLDESAPLPFARLTDEFHVHTDVIGLLRFIRPDIASFVGVTQGNDGMTTPSGSSWLIPA